MAELDDLGFWLPSEFLTDDDVLTDFKPDLLKTRRNDDYSYGFGISSDLSSPTTETESDEDYDDRISELSRKLSLSALQDSNFSTDYTAKGWKLSGSPQSTLCGCKAGSRSSPNSLSGVCSPPEVDDQRRWDMLYAAAGEVARMRMIEETAAFCSSNQRFVPHAKPSPFTVSQQSRNPNPNPFYPNHQAQTQNQRSYQLLQAAKFQQMKQHQMMKGGVHSQGLAEFPVQNGRRNGGDPPVLPSFQQPGSGMRAVFLGETGVKKERTGTGVFLPQRFGSVPPETRKKPGCSTVLLPEKVVHALNFNRDAIDAQALNRSNGSFYNDFEAGLNPRNNHYLMAEQRRRQAVMNQQLRLPQEWTY